MECKEIVSELMKLRGYTYDVLAEKCGYANRSSVYTVLNHKMKTSILKNIASALDCTVTIKSKLTDKGEWELEPKSVREIMKLRGFTYASLAEKCGYTTASGVSNKVSRSGDMRIDTMSKFVSAMDCEIIVKSKLTDRGEWKIG